MEQNIKVTTVTVNLYGGQVLLENADSGSSSSILLFLFFLSGTRA
jgi:hypothetical protein